MSIENLVGIGKKSDLKVSIVGGSNSVMRRGYTKYLKRDLAKEIGQSISFKYYALGGVPNIYSVIQQERHDLAATSDLVFFEYCANDRYAMEDDRYNLDLSAKSLEGFIRKVKQSNSRCLIVLLLFGINSPDFYAGYCCFRKLYKSIGKEYNLPTIDLTEVLSRDGGIEHIKSLFNNKDRAHYARPHGVKAVSKAIVNELNTLGIIDLLKSKRRKLQITDRIPIYPDNFENLKYFDRFESGNYFTSKPKISVYQNTVYREKNFKILPDNSLQFLLKGKLMLVFIKSDKNDGFVEIKFDNQSIVTSSYNSWVHKIKPQNVINFMALPMHKFEPSADFASVSISICSQYPSKFELGYSKIVPLKNNPKKWKLSIIGIAYIGEIKPIDA